MGKKGSRSVCLAGALAASADVYILSGRKLTGAVEDGDAKATVLGLRHLEALANPRFSMVSLQSALFATTPRQRIGSEARTEISRYYPLSLRACGGRPGRRVIAFAVAAASVRRV
ncbi:hypothetical protein R3P38DRAFT_2795953 [Favolaschia claudopus]|uniref:Uncharacterized protein n=1 Tax=Favolaschia claudopus TaxID=2862362 RepID=A0AAW0A5T8_9AGAR